MSSHSAPSSPASPSGRICRSRTALAAVAGLCTLTVATGAQAQPLIRAQSASNAHQGATVQQSTATLINGVLTTTRGAGASEATGSPVGPNPTEAYVRTAQPGFNGQNVFRNDAQASANLITATLTAGSGSTPINNFATPSGITQSRIEDTVYFLNPTAAAITVPVGLTFHGDVLMNSAGPPGSYYNLGQLGMMDVSGFPIPTLVGTPGGSNILNIEPANGAIALRNPLSGANFPMGPGPVWNISPSGNAGAAAAGALSIAPGVSAMRIVMHLDLFCNGGVTCSYTSPGLVLTLDPRPHGVLMSSQSGVFLGAPPPSPAPTALTIDSIAGNRVTLRWTPPTTAAATGYLLEGGLVPGQTLASLPTGSTASTFTFDAPTGAFYLRVRALTASGPSATTNEVLAYVNVPAPPSAPTGLLGVVSGSRLGLSWRNTAAGGTPTAMQLDVSGAITTSLLFGVGETFDYTGVPAGTYTFAVRAVNSSGASAPSPPVTLTFPGACSGVPQAPANLQVSRTGNYVSLTWDPPSTGPAVSSYVLNVSGTLSLQIPVATRTIGGAVGPGSYTLSVAAVNPCGQGPATAPQTVSVP